MVIDADKQYEILHPRTGDKETWSGQRIICYHNVYGGELKLAPKEEKVVIPPKKTTTRRKRKKRT